MRSASPSERLPSINPKGMYGLRDKSSAELVEKGIAPIQKDRWTEGPPQIKLPVLESTREERSEQPPQKLSKRQLKKVGLGS